MIKMTRMGIIGGGGTELAENMGKRENNNGMEGREWPKL
jgi:hypothetical protein